MPKQQLDQTRAPIYEALFMYRSARVVPFDVPGHKKGRGNLELTEFLGKDCMAADVNAMKPLDNLCHPTSVILEAHQLAADAFGAAHAFFMVNGTTSAVQAMIMSVCREGDAIILPRNVHRSAISALVLCGARPIYVDPGLDRDLGIPLGMTTEALLEAMDRHPEAKAVMVNHPTYYGVCSDIQTIVKYAHERKMKVLADEAHGTHFYFHDKLAPSAMAAGCDLSSVSMHKTGGSLTQSSLLLLGPDVDEGYLRQTINLTQTTSASYLLLSSLDLSRRNLALRGEMIFDRIIRMADYAREEINAIGGYLAFSTERRDGKGFFDFDVTKLSVHTRKIGLAGIEVYDYLRDEYDIQIEFGDLANILAVISVGDRQQEIERLVSALSEIRRRYQQPPSGLMDHEYIHPIVEMTPKEAFYAAQKTMSLADSLGHISAESVMCYPPGIPILAPGERITKDILDYIVYAKEKGSQMTGTRDLGVASLRVVD